MKKLSLVIASLLASSPLYALGLGNPQLHSHLGESLEVSVPLYLSQAEQASLGQMRAVIGDRAMFERMNLEFRENLQQITVSVKQQGTNSWLLLRSEFRVAEPLLEFPLDVSLDGNRLVRGVTLLLDPPGMTPAQAAVVRPVAQATPRPVSAPTTTDRTMPVPATTVLQHASMSPQATNGSYGPVGLNQTLGEIAQQVRPDGATLHQTLVGLWQANPNAFMQNNMNRLMAGSTLHIPTAEQVLALDPADARKEVVAQYQTLRTGVTQTASRPVATRAPQASTQPQVLPASKPETIVEPILKPSEPIALPPTTSEEPRLSLLAPSSLEQIPEVFQEEVKLLGNRLRTLDEENRELRDRIAGLEEHISTLSKQMVLLAENTLALSGAEAERMAALMEQIDTEKVQKRSEAQVTTGAGSEITDERPEVKVDERPIASLDSGLETITDDTLKTTGPWLRYLLIGGVLVLTVGIAAIWFRRLRQRERYRDIMYRF